MHKIIFYPVGNGDTSQIILENGKRILFDFRHKTISEKDDTPEINLQKTLKQELADDNKDYFDVVAFTHGDKDHIENSTEFFELLHASKYQGKKRIKINELWVPAAMILETATNDQQSNEFVIWRQEARHRLREGKGIRVFSKPEKLKKWMEDNKIDYDKRKHLITDAGKTVDNFSLDSDGIEFFCHSPFIKQVDEGDDLRNKAALIFNIRMKQGNEIFDYLAVGDSEWSVMADIVDITKSHKNQDRLDWDLYNIPHHCSYLALSDDKGKNKTVPKPQLEELLRRGKKNAYIVSSSKPIENTQQAKEQSLPPHIQAKNCYKQYLIDIQGSSFLTTMEHNSITAPKPIIFHVTQQGLSLEQQCKTPRVSLLGTQAPRAGNS